MNIGSLEIFNYIKSKCETKSELAEEINDLLISSYGSEFSQQLNEVWQEYCKAYSICTCCGSQIDILTERERLEDEPIYFKVCPNCG